MPAAQAGVYERKLGKTAGFMCLGENELILLCGKCKEEIKEKTIGPCPCELCSLWYCKERKKTGTTVAWIRVRSSGCGSVHRLYIFLGTVVPSQKKYVS